MSDQPSAPAAPSGLRIREILTETKLVNGKPVVVPALDTNGNEIEIYSVDVPQEIEAEGAAAVEAHVAKVVAGLNLTRPELLAARAPNPAAVVESAPTPPTFAEGAES